jgi:hypothetical protein
MKNILAALFVFIAANAFALDIITRDGKAYQDCAVKTVERDGVRVVHRDGTAFLDFDDLPSAIQKQYGWTEEKSAARKSARAAEAEKQRVAAETQRKAQEAARIAAEQVKADDEHRLRAAVASEQAARLANEERQRREAEERKQAVEQNRTTRMYSIICGITLLYFLPTFVGRKKRNIAALFMLNLFGYAGLVGFFYGCYYSANSRDSSLDTLFVYFLAFSVLVWIAELVWALIRDSRPREVIQTVVVHAPPQQSAPQPRPVIVPRAIAKAPAPPHNPQLPPGA